MGRFSPPTNRSQADRERLRTGRGKSAQTRESPTGKLLTRLVRANPRRARVTRPTLRRGRCFELNAWIPRSSTSCGTVRSSTECHKSLKWRDRLFSRATGRTLAGSPFELPACPTVAPSRLGCFFADLRPPLEWYSCGTLPHLDHSVFADRYPQGRGIFRPQQPSRAGSRRTPSKPCSWRRPQPEIRHSSRDRRDAEARAWRPFR